MWRVSGQITEFKLEGDSDIHLVLFGDGAYLIAERPAAPCIPKKARDRGPEQVRNALRPPGERVAALGAVVVISGVGFFDIPPIQQPHGGNFAELHPVTGLTIVAGC